MLDSTSNFKNARTHSEPAQSVCAALRPTAPLRVHLLTLISTGPQSQKDWPPQCPRGSPREVPPDNGRPLLRYGRVEQNLHQTVLLPGLLLLGGNAGTKLCAGLALLMHRRARAAEPDCSAAWRQSQSNSGPRPHKISSLSSAFGLARPSCKIFRAKCSCMSLVTRDSGSSSGVLNPGQTKINARPSQSKSSGPQRAPWCGGSTAQSSCVAPLVHTRPRHTTQHNSSSMVFVQVAATCRKTSAVDLHAQHLHLARVLDAL